MPKNVYERVTTFLWIASAIAIFTLAGLECYQQHQACSQQLEAINKSRNDITARIISNLR